MQSAVHSFSSRRPAAGGLPQFHLPPPNSGADPHIPRVTGSDGLSPLSSGVNSGSSQNSQTGIAPYSSSWGTSYTYSSIGPNGPSATMQPNYNRPMYSPGAPGPPGQSYSSRNSHSPTAGELQPPPSYDTSFGMSMSGGANHHSSLLSQPSHLQNPVLNSQASQPPTPSTGTASTDPFSRPSRTPSYYSAPSSTPQQASFPAFSSTQPSPTLASPTTAGPGGRGMPPLGSQPHTAMQGHHPFRGSYGFPPLPPAIGGTIMSNMGNPGGQMSLLGPVPNHLTGAYHPHHPIGHTGIYGQAQSAQQDRPFRCDQCPQAFNRNHDLKRHKRIHLSVKPYPCEYCEKAFSRKDALKRHRLVKGCGNEGNKSPTSASGGSPPDDNTKHELESRVKHEPDTRIKHELS